MLQIDLKDSDHIIQSIVQTLFTPFDFSALMKQMGISETQAQAHQYALTDQYFLTPSRAPVFDLLRRFLLVSHSKDLSSQMTDKIPKAQLSGFCISGVSGIGKTALVKAALQQEGYGEILPEDRKTT